MLQMNLVMEDKISLDELQEEIQEFEDYVQSTDVAGEFGLACKLDEADNASHAKIVKYPKYDNVLVD